MNKEILLVFISAFILVEFYFPKSRLITLTEYFALSVILFGLSDFNLLVFLIGLISVAGYLLSELLFRFIRKYYHSEQFYFFGKLVLNFFLIVTAVYYLTTPAKHYGLLSDHFTVLKWIAGILLVMKPSNIIFKEIFGTYKPEQEDSEDLKINQAGSKIGSLERILIFICLAAGQYTAIGLIFTAKSVTRYDKIAHEKAFAEYYLLGTFTSVLLAVIWYIAVMKWL